MTKFKVGDKAIFNPQWEGDAGEKWNNTVVNIIPPNWTNSIFACRVGHPDGSQAWAHEFELTPVSKKTQGFKIGDRVVFNNTSCLNDKYNGKIGVLIEPINPDIWPFRISFDDGLKCGVNLNEITLAPTVDEEPTKEERGNYFDMGWQDFVQGAFAKKAYWDNKYYRGGWLAASTKA